MRVAPLSFVGLGLAGLLAGAMPATAASPRPSPRANTSAGGRARTGTRI